ncbi:MAG: hypothetical protein HYX40_06100 [Sphingobacteriales bacterium]|nr:hypothetical protein [Sphingobacteriales bacterium]
MFDLLREYASLHHHIGLPGIGTITLEHSSEKVKDGEEVTIPGIGILKNNEVGLLQLETIVSENQLLKPVIAERVIRKNETHTILVGDSEKTSVQMSEWLNETGSVANAKWWAWAAAILVIALGMIAYSFSANDWRSSATGNQQTITPLPPPAEISAAFK